MNKVNLSLWGKQTIANNKILAFQQKRNYGKYVQHNNLDNFPIFKDFSVDINKCDFLYFRMKHASILKIWITQYQHFPNDQDIRLQNYV